MEVVSLAVEGGSFFAERLPGFIARRIFTAKKISSQISVTLRGAAPVSVGGNPKVLSVWFDITNQSSLDLKITALSAEVWFGQPVGYLTSLIPVDIPRRSQVTSIRAAIVLCDELASYARRVAEQQPSSVSVYFNATCKTSACDFVLSARMERDARDTRFDGAPLGSLTS